MRESELSAILAATRGRRLELTQSSPRGMRTHHEYKETRWTPQDADSWRRDVHRVCYDSWRFGVAMQTNSDYQNEEKVHGNGCYIIATHYARNYHEHFIHLLQLFMTSKASIQQHSNSFIFDCLYIVYSQQHLLNPANTSITRFTEINIYLTENSKKNIKLVLKPECL